MKNLLKSTLFAVVMLGTYTVTANTLENKTEITKDYTFDKGNRVSVIDKDGTIIYSGTVNYNSNLTQLFDFSQLKNGIYTIEVDKDFEIDVNQVEVNNSSVNFLEGKNDTVFKPVFRVDKDIVIISKLGLDTNTMKIELYYENDVISSETITGNEALNRVYKLDRTIKGDYTAVVKFNGRAFTKSFSL